MREAAKQRFPAGRVVRGTVTAHRPFGILVDLVDPVATGLVQVTEFLDGGRMTPEQYPAVGGAVTAVVLGHTGEGRKQVWLCMRPSILQRPADPGAAPGPARGGGSESSWLTRAGRAGEPGRSGGTRSLPGRGAAA